MKHTDNLDDDIREESCSEDEESSSSSDEMSFERPKEFIRSSSVRSSQDPVFSNRRSSEMSMPGSSILESINTPPHFRKRSCAMTQDEKHSRPSEISQNSGSFQTTNGQLCKCY